MDDDIKGFLLVFLTGVIIGFGVCMSVSVNRIEKMFSGCKAANLTLEQCATARGVFDRR